MNDLRTGLSLAARFQLLNGGSDGASAPPNPVADTSRVGIPPLLFSPPAQRTISIPTATGEPTASAATVVPSTQLIISTAVQPPPAVRARAAATNPVVGDVLRELVLVLDAAAGVYFRSGQFLLAISCYDRALQLIKPQTPLPGSAVPAPALDPVPMEASLSVKRGDCFRSCGDLPAAVASYERAAAVHASTAGERKTAGSPSQPGGAAAASGVNPLVVADRLGLIHFEQARIAFNQLNYARAIEQFTRAISYAPSHAAYYTGRAQAAYFVQDISGAYRDLTTAVRLDPTNSDAANRLHALRGQFVAPNDRHAMSTHESQSYTATALPPSIRGYLKDTHFNAHASISD